MPSQLLSRPSQSSAVGVTSPTHGPHAELAHVCVPRAKLRETALSLGKFRIEENALWSFAPHDVSMILALFAFSGMETPLSASGEVAAQRESLARATAALDRAIDVLLPRDSAAVYSTFGAAERSGRGGTLQA